MTESNDSCCWEIIGCRHSLSWAAKGIAATRFWHYCDQILLSSGVDLYPKENYSVAVKH